MSLVAILPQQDPSIFLIRTSNFLLELGKKAKFIKVEEYFEYQEATVLGVDLETSSGA